MIKLKIFNMEEFLKVVNECIGPVNLFFPGNEKTDISRNDAVQRELQRSHAANGRALSLRLEIPRAGDYMSIVYFSIGDC